MLLRQVAAWIRSWFLFTATWYAPAGTSSPVFTHSLRGPLGWCLPALVCLDSQLPGRSGREWCISSVAVTHGLRSTWSPAPQSGTFSSSTLVRSRGSQEPLSLQDMSSVLKTFFHTSCPSWELCQMGEEIWSLSLPWLEQKLHPSALDPSPPLPPSILSTVPLCPQPPPLLPKHPLVYCQLFNIYLT